MWPLTTAASHASKADEATQWLCGAGRVYFDEFRNLWRDTHARALRVLPPTDEIDRSIIRHVEKRLDAEFRAVLEATHELELDEDTLAVPSIWTRVPLATTTDVPHSANERRDSSMRPCFRTRSPVPRQCGLGSFLDRRDRRHEDESFLRLQEQAHKLVETQVQGLPALPDCPQIWIHLDCAWKNGGTRVCTKVSQPRYSITTRHCMTTRLTKTLARPRMVEYSNQFRRSSINPAKKLAIEASRVLEFVLATTSDEALAVEEGEDNIKSFFRQIKPSLFLGARNIQEPTTVKIPSDMLATKIVECTQLGPRRVKFDGLLNTIVPSTSMTTVASSICKEITKKNASMMAVCAVPNTLLHDINVILKRANTRARLNGNFKNQPNNVVRLRELPPEIIKHDCMRLEDSHLHFQCQAQRLCKLILQPTISITNLSLNLPSIWRHPFTLRNVRDAKSRQLSMLEVESKDTGELSSGGLPHEVEDEPMLETDVTLPESTRHAEDETSLRVPPSAVPARIKTIYSSSDIVSLAPKHVTFRAPDDVSTDDLVSSYLRVERIQENHDDQLHNPGCSPEENDADASFACTIEQLARPAVWYLVRLKLLKVNSSSLFVALKSIELEVLETVTIQLHEKLKEVSKTSAKMQAESIMEICSAFRYAVWLHTIRMVVECRCASQHAALDMMSRALKSPVYHVAIGSKQILALSNLYVLMGGNQTTITNFVPEIPRNVERETGNEPQMKKSRKFIAQAETIPVRVVCDVRILQQDELLEAMSDLEISIVERELGAAVDLVIDERNAIVLLAEEHFTEEFLMRELTYSLASCQVQFEKLWIIIGDVQSEQALHFFYAALANFVVEVQTFVCNGATEISEVVRGIVDTCAEIALSHHRILPKMWFARPFVLEEESQLERFLSSTRIMSTFAAQSVLYKVAIEDLTMKGLKEIAHLVGSSLSANQVDLLWR